MLTIIIPLIVCLFGLVLFIMNTPPPVRWARVGEIMFFCGLLVCCFLAAKQPLHLP